MSDEALRRPRRCGRVSPEARISLSGDVTTATAAALAAPPGSAAAVQAAQEALFHLLTALGPALPNVIDKTAHASPQEQRAGWLRAVRFFAGSEKASDLHSLALALVELDRGVTAPALVAREGGRIGGLADTEQLVLMRFAVEAANGLAELCVKVAEYEAELKACGTARSTIDGYRKKLSSGPPELRPRSYTLAWGKAPPELVLQRVIWALRDAQASKV